MIKNFLTISALLLIAIFFCSQAAASTIVTTSGEEMVINVNTTKESNITVLNFAADGTVTRLYPNKLARDNREEPGRNYQIPAPEDRPFNGLYSSPTPSGRHCRLPDYQPATMISLV